MNCAQVRRDNDMIAVGNLRFPDGPLLSYIKAEWSAFLDDAQKADSTISRHVVTGCGEQTSGGLT